jgi:hypothetical protein
VALNDDVCLNLAAIVDELKNRSATIQRDHALTVNAVLSVNKINAINILKLADSGYSVYLVFRKENKTTFRLTTILQKQPIFHVNNKTTFSIAIRETDTTEKWSFTYVLTNVIK